MIIEFIEKQVTSGLLDIVNVASSYLNLTRVPISLNEIKKYTMYYDIVFDEKK